MRLSSSDSDAVLEFSDVRGDYFQVTLSAHDHSATQRVYTFADAPGPVQPVTGKAGRDPSRGGPSKVSSRWNCASIVLVTYRLMCTFGRQPGTPIYGGLLLESHWMPGNWTSLPETQPPPGRAGASASSSRVAGSVRNDTPDEVTSFSQGGGRSWVHFAWEATTRPGGASSLLRRRRPTAGGRGCRCRLGPTLRRRSSGTSSRASACCCGR